MDPAGRPTRVRYGVIGFALALAIVTYVDRVCIAQAAPFIRKDLGLSTQQMAWAFAAFAWAYALMEIPGGYLGDRIGARKALTRVVIWWSFFTAATGWVRSLPGLIVTRAAFGAGEAGCFPNVARMFATWVPADSRTRAQGLMWCAAHWGGAFTPMAVALLLQHFSWRLVFQMFGLLGIVWALAFFAWYRDRPDDHRGTNAAERAMLPAAGADLAHGPVPWAAFVRSPTVWLLWGQYMAVTFGWTFYITWLPTYLLEARGLDLKTTAVFAGFPLFFGGIGSLVSGTVSAPLGRRLGVARARRLLAVTGCAGACVCLVITGNIRDTMPAMLVMGMASFCNDLALPGAWAACMDIGGRHVGTLSGSMNMMGNLMAGVAPLAVSLIVAWSGRDWTLVFYAGAVMYALAGVCWWLLRSARPIEEGAAEEGAAA